MIMIDERTIELYQTWLLLLCVLLFIWRTICLNNCFLFTCSCRFYTISGSLKDTPPAKDAHIEMWDRHLDCVTLLPLLFGRYALFPALCALHLPNHTLPVICSDIINRSPLLPMVPESRCLFAPTLDLCVLPAASHLFFLGNTSFPQGFPQSVE